MLPNDPTRRKPLKLHSDPPSARHIVTACAPGHVAVNGRTYTRSLLLAPERLDTGWGPDSYAALATDHIAALTRQEGDVLLIGTGLRQRFPPADLLRPLIEAGRGFEVMDTAAACRTYNILVAEGRTVLAALIVETQPHGDRT